MKIKLGSLITDASGKIGGHVVTSSIGGKVLKTKGNSRSKGKNYGLIGQGNISRFSSLWRTISQDERDSFIAAAKTTALTDIFGDKIQMSGFNLFVRLNSHASMGGFPVVNSYLPATPFIFGRIVAGNFYYYGRLLALALSVFPPANSHFVLYVSSPLPASVSARYLQYSFVSFTLNVNEGLTFSFPDSFDFTPFLVGGVVKIRVHQVLVSGHLGTPLFFDCNIV